MLSWIVVVVLYLCGMGFFRLLGGVGGAAGALERRTTRPSSAFPIFWSH